MYEAVEAVTLIKIDIVERFKIKQLIFCKFHEQVLSCCANEPNQGFMVR
jgi:hypothetical protein